MKRTLLITAAAGALIAGMNIAAAQMSQQPAASGSGGAQLEQKGSASGGAREQRGSAQQRGSGQAETKGQGGADMKAQGGADMKAQGQARETQGQAREGQREQGQAREGQRDQGQARDQQRNQGQAREGQGRDQGKAAQRGGGGDAKSLTTEQRTKIRETVIKSGPRVTNVNFSLSVGTVVPRTVTFAPLPAVLVEIYPQWRSYRYFIVEEKIVIIDDGFRIVTIITV